MNFGWSFFLQFEISHLCHKIKKRIKELEDVLKICENGILQKGKEWCKFVYFPAIFDDNFYFYSRFEQINQKFAKQELEEKEIEDDKTQTLLTYLHDQKNSKRMFLIMNQFCCLIFHF